VILPCYKVDVQVCNRALDPQNKVSVPGTPATNIDLTITPKVVQDLREPIFIQVQRGQVLKLPPKKLVGKEHISRESRLQDISCLHRQERTEYGTNARKETGSLSSYRIIHPLIHPPPFFSVRSQQDPSKRRKLLPRRASQCAPRIEPNASTIFTGFSIHQAYDQGLV
jgi:hypothetical protein